MELFNAPGQVRVHLLVVMPVPLEALAKAGHPLATPVLTPQTGDLDAFFQTFVHDVKAALAAALCTNDQAVIDPLRQLRLASKKGGELFQQLHKGRRRLNADKARHVPALQLVVTGVAEVEIAVSGGIHVEVVVTAGNVGGLRVVGVVVVTTCAAVFHVAAPCHIGGLVAPDTRFAGPQGEVTAPQIEVAHLLAAAVDVLVLGSFHPKPEAVDLLCLLGHGQGDCAVFLGDQQLEPAFQIQLRSLRRHMGRRQRQGAALQQVVL